MSGHVMRVDRPTFDSNDSGSGSDAEVRAAFKGHVSYFGTYTIDPIRAHRDPPRSRRVVSELDWSPPNPD
jgi:hypothetical protein